MATFRVGQRVRLVAAYHPEAAASIGLIGTIAAVGPVPLKPTHALVGEPPFADYSVKWDDGRRTEALAWQLAPATDCYDKADWRECVWQPPHMRDENDYEVIPDFKRMIEHFKRMIERSA